MSLKVSHSASFSCTAWPPRARVRLWEVEARERALPWGGRSGEGCGTWRCGRAERADAPCSPATQRSLSSTVAARKYHTESPTDTSNRSSSSSWETTAALATLMAPRHPKSVSLADL